uniref:Uncharacterized protein n=1 Tax=Corethron hystrix TaxID=216773 RepID=A0A7S1BZY1_9STRA|mmetsp:Transcript_6844/g.14772  ORF Transcript_6844/g.14772 Transcript_6844/m.14772 type:complete len:269 (+) Transcript_6844:129-935(+)
MIRFLRCEQWILADCTSLADGTSDHSMTFTHTVLTTNIKKSKVSTGSNGTHQLETAAMEMKENVTFLEEKLNREGEVCEMIFKLKQKMIKTLAEVIAAKEEEKKYMLTKLNSAKEKEINEIETDLRTVIHRYQKSVKQYECEQKSFLKLGKSFMEIMGERSKKSCKNVSDWGKNLAKKSTQPGRILMKKTRLHSEKITNGITIPIDLEVKALIDKNSYSYFDLEEKGLSTKGSFKDVAMAPSIDKRQPCEVDEHASKVIFNSSQVPAN